MGTGPNAWQQPQLGAVDLVERKTGYLLVRRVLSKSPRGVAEKTIKALARFKVFCLTLTNDDGFEFRAHRGVSRELGIRIYFTHRYSSWARIQNIELKAPGS